MPSQAGPDFAGAPRPPRLPHLKLGNTLASNTERRIRTRGVLFIMCFIGVLNVFSFNPAFAQQTHFASRADGAWGWLDFGWRDAARQPHTLSFALPLDDLRRGADEFTLPPEEAMHAFVAEKMQAYARQHSVGGVRIEVARKGNGFDVRAEGPPGADLDGHMSALRRVQEDAQETFLNGRFYTKIGAPNGVNTFMPDHVRLVARYTPALQPLVEALRAQTQGLDDRQTVNHVLQFLQSIPYDTLENRQTSMGAGFITPYGLLGRNRGDCDSKSVALAAILRGLRPNLSLVMVYVPQHALLAVGLPQGPHDYALKLKEGVFVLADPTGPALLPLGRTGPEVTAQLGQGVSSYRVIL